MEARGTRPVPFVGLTGGMGAGKSEALRALERLGVATLSTDAVVHELLGEDEVARLLVERLGDGVAPQGRVDRDALARIVFERPDDRVWLERMLWPRVGARVVAWRSALEAAAERPPAAVVEVPLLFEAGMEGGFDSTIAVVAGDEVRRGRLDLRGQERDEGREARQLSQDEKAARAEHVVVNDGTLEELELSLSRVLANIVA